MKSKDKPYILYVAEKIYLEVSEIKKKNPVFENIIKPQVLSKFEHIFSEVITKTRKKQKKLSANRH